MFHASPFTPPPSRHRDGPSCIAIHSSCARGSPCVAREGWETDRRSLIGGRLVCVFFLAQPYTPGHRFSHVRRSATIWAPAAVVKPVLCNAGIYAQNFLHSGKSEEMCCLNVVNDRLLRCDPSKEAALSTAACWPRPSILRCTAASRTHVCVVLLPRPMLLQLLPPERAATR